MQIATCWACRPGRRSSGGIGCARLFHVFAYIVPTERPSWNLGVRFFMSWALRRRTLAGWLVETTGKCCKAQSKAHHRQRERHSTTSRLDLPITNGVPDPQKCSGAPPSLLKQTKTASFVFLLAIVSQMTENTIFQNERRVLKALVTFGEVHFTWRK